MEKHWKYILILIIVIGAVYVTNSFRPIDFGATLVYPSRGGTGKNTSSWGTSSSAVLVSITDGVWGTSSAITSESDPIWVASSSEYLTSILIGNNYIGTSSASTTDWQNTLITVNASGSNWSLALARADSANATLTASSSDWQSAYIDVSASSSNWSEAYGIISASSSDWATAYIERGSQIAGNYLTWDATDIDLDLDTEIVSSTINFDFTNATTTVASRRDIYIFVPLALTIHEIGCYTESGTSALVFGECNGNSLATSSEILNTLVCDTDNASSVTFLDGSIAARRRIMIQVTGVTNSTNTYGYIIYSKDD